MFFFQFEISINVFVISFHFISMPMLAVYGHYKYFTLAVRFTLSDVRMGRLENRRETLSFTSSLLLKFNNISFHFMTDIIAHIKTESAART